MKAIERLYEYLQAKGIKNRAAESELGLSNGYIGKSLNRDADLGAVLIEKICNTYADINLRWLVMGEGPMLKTWTTTVDVSDKLKHCLESKEVLEVLLKEKVAEVESLKAFRKKVRTKL